MNRLPANPIIGTGGGPTKTFRALLNLFDINETRPDAILDAVQKQWRKLDKKPAEIGEEHGAFKDRALPLFRELGMLGIPDLEPSTFQWVAVLGATYVAMHKRYATAIRAHREQGLRGMNAALLTSRRPRFKDDKETDDVLSKPVSGGLAFASNWARPATMPETEHGIGQMILGQVGHHRPWSLDREHLVVAEDKQSGGNAGTVETFRAFADQCDPRGDALLVVSSQPHMLRQLLEGATILGDRFARYVVTGYDVPPKDVVVTRMLDELAKTFWDIFSPNPY